MGKPLNNNLFGNPLDTTDNLPVLVLTSAMLDGQTLSNVYIEKQTKPTEYYVSNGSVSGLVDLVPNDPTENGEACMKVITPSGDTVYAVKIYLNTIECSDGNTYYWNRYNYTAGNDETIIVNSMVPSQYKAALGINETGDKISGISVNINHQSFTSDPASTNVSGVGGTGVNASFNIISTSKPLYAVDNVSVKNGGQNYHVGDKITVPNVGLLIVKTVQNFPNYIDSFTLNQNDQLYPSDVSGTYTLTGGTGVSAVLECKSVSSTGYEASSVVIGNGGSGYKAGDVITTSYGTLNITSVNESTYGITGMTVTPPTTVFSNDPAATNIAVTGGSGSKASFNITSSKVYEASSVTIASGGTSYKANDKITIPNVGTVLVDTVDIGTQGILSVSMNQSKTYSSTKDFAGTISASGGSGTGATFTVVTESVPLYQYASVATNNAGTGYAVGDTITVTDVVAITVKSVTSGGAIETISSKFLDTNLYNVQTNLTSQAGSGGSGTGATFDITQSQNGTGYIAKTVTVKTEGSGYSSSDILTTTFGTLSITKLDNGTGAIKSITFTSDSTYHSIDPAGNAVAGTGGSGTGATFTVISQFGYQITDISVGNEGQNYKVGDKVTITSYTTELSSITTSISATVTSIETGNYAVTGLQFSKPMILPTDPGGANIAVTGGSGSGLTVNIISQQVTGYKIVSNELSNTGYGYTVGDNLTVNGVGTLTVNTVKSIFGIINSVIQIDDTSVSYSDMGNTSLEVVGGSGTGLTLNISSKETPQYFISNIELDNVGAGYTVGDILRVGNAGSVTVTTIG